MKALFSLKIDNMYRLKIHEGNLLRRFYKFFYSILILSIQIYFPVHRMQRINIHIINKRILITLLAYLGKMLKMYEMLGYSHLRDNEILL